MLARLNPFRSLPNPREVWAWGMYDLANQSFTLLIITLLFSLYVQQVVTPHPALTPEQADAIRAAIQTQTSLTPELESLRRSVELADRSGAFHWSLMHGGSLILVVLLSPVIGALADIRGWRKQVLIGTGIACAALTCALGLVGPGQLLLAALLYIPANLCYQIGENFLASFLPDVSTPRNIGRVSATGWTMGYVGALLLLVAALIGMIAFDLRSVTQWRPLFVFAGLWFAVNMIPTILFLRDDAPQPEAGSLGLIRASIGRVLETVTHTSHYRQLALFLTAFLIYGFGVQVVIGFASIIAKSFGFEQTDLVIFVAQITVTAGVAAFGTGRFQDAIGAKTTVLIYLLVWMLSCGGLVAVKLIWPVHGPQWPLWVIGNGLGFGLGGIGTASRSMVGRLTPRHRTAEFFGLWGVSYKLAGALGVLSFGAVARAFGELASLCLLFGFFVVGFLLVLPVDEIAGVRAARRAERARLNSSKNT
ncbi:MAG: MFS transporter [Phycisphaerales bacterium]